MQNRIQYDDDGSLDEIVTDGGAHLERMEDDDWFLRCERADGTSLAIWFRGNITMMEERDAGGFRRLQDKLRAIISSSYTIDEIEQRFGDAFDAPRQGGLN
jgi:hypothetical protein